MASLKLIKLTTELNFIYKLYYTGSLRELIAEDFTDYSETSKRVADLLCIRAKIALFGKFEEEKKHVAIVHGAEAVQACEMLEQLAQEKVLITQSYLDWQKLQDDALVACHLATALIAIKEYSTALEILSAHSKDSEAVFLTIVAHLLSGARHKAEDLLKTQSLDENALLQIAEALLLVSSGLSAQCERAYFIFEDLASVSSSTQCSTASAICKLRQGQPEEAAAILEEQFDAEIDMDPDRIVDRMICQYFALGDYKETRAELIKQRPNHRLLQESKAKAAEFAQLAQNWKSVHQS